MPVNEPKPVKLEDIFTEIFPNFFHTGYAGAGGATATPKDETDEPAVDSLKETYRLLKKAEESDYSSETAKLIQIADRHIRILDLALSSQR